MTLVRAARTEPVFVTAPWTRERVVAGRRERRPVSEAHAKTLGTNTTLCGLTTTAWVKLWHLPFDSVGLDRCPRCTDELAARLARARGQDRSGR